jgi:protein-glutamine gamma-glutamyltransferase
MNGTTPSFIRHFPNPSMFLERLLQITIAALAAMGTALLGMGQREELLPLAMCFAAGMSVWITDIKGLFRLSRKWANFAMLALALILLPSLYPFQSQDQAQDFARFLAYLQIILLFQKKDSRIYWQLLMLSMLQVLVGSLSGPGVFFGILLVTYMLAATLGLTLMTLGRYGGQGEKIEKSERNPRNDNRLLTAAIPPGGSPGAKDDTRSVPTTGLRWPWIDQEPQFVGIPAESGRQGVGRELIRRLARMSFFTFGLTLVLFILVPRFGQFGVSGGAALRSQRMVGFSDQVTLGVMGQLIENSDEVLRIRFLDHATNTLYPVQGEIYLRGTIQTIYKNSDPRNTGWNVGSPRNMPGSRQLAAFQDPLPKDMVRQECTIEGLRNCSKLFYVAPYVPLKTPKDWANIEVDDQYFFLRRSSHLSMQKFTYRLGTTAFRNGRQLPLIPADPYDNPFIALQLPPRKTIPKLIELAETWIRESGIPADDPYGRAKYLEHQLALSGLFRYSMEMKDLDPDLDPTEDFVSRGRTGHCEYFASALTLMLRSLKIPARRVTGFKCDEWNQFGQCYEVRNLHAHAWVEAYLREKRIPPDLLHGKDAWEWKNGGWLQLDPTPMHQDESRTGFLTPVRWAYQWLDHAWSFYVVELTYERQHDSIYQPLATGAKKVYAVVIDRGTWRSIFASLLDIFHLGALPDWIKITLLVLIGLLWLGLVGGLGWLGYRTILRRRRRRCGGAVAPSRRVQVEIEFYHRLEQLLSKIGLTRSVGQTPREFALSAGQHLMATTGQLQLAPLPVQVVEAFYRVRFGRLPLDKSQAETVEQVLAQIKENL